MDSKSSRRTFLRGTAAAGVVGMTGMAGMGLSAESAAAAPSAGGTTRPTVAVLGGGIAGMTAAHELVERGFDVTVYERRVLGGMARSIPVPGTARGGRADLPGEHSLRIYFGFYHDLPDTLKRIPVPGRVNGVHDNLVDAGELVFAHDGGRADLHVPLTINKLDAITPDALLAVATGLAAGGLQLPPDEAAVFAQRVLVYMTSSEQRRLGQWDNTTWPDFLRAEGKSQDYRRVLVDTFTRALSATKTADASAHTTGLVFENLLFNILGRGNEGAVDRVMNAPTNEAFIDPWERHLTSLGVRFRVGWSVEDLVLSGGRISAAQVRDPQGVAQQAKADYFVCALDVRSAARVWNKAVRAADPQLATAATLDTEWMAGIQFYLDRRTPLANGHTFYVDSPWKLTTTTQAEFWDRDLPAQYGDGQVKEIVSTIIAEWDVPGVLYGKPAKQLTAEQISREVWAQLKLSLNDTGQTVLTDSSLLTWFLDSGVTGLGGPNPQSADELMVHPVGSWARRPTSRTAIPNLALAGDYVRVPINGASMEGANSSGRQAANVVLDAAGSQASRVPVFGLTKAPELELLKVGDQQRYAAGLPNLFDV
ncbi:FAD-dependent oxidoreductase [Streptomyces sp. J2-1]|uniref:hydroxysqualene dehydroxylase n=1 Tax=Streptomyces corallincola TaxID=2851888 RepID=UPI001C38C733|nr:FAD-dependent oxidoreductase [Streptomyces corallincola]MBV2355535.1 FAD-dependent oxidoreductase [Streptomyces corallincola]